MATDAPARWCQWGAQAALAMEARAAGLCSVRDSEHARTCSTRRMSCCRAATDNSTVQIGRQAGKYISVSQPETAREHMQGLHRIHRLAESASVQNVLILDRKHTDTYRPQQLGWMARCAAGSPLMSTTVGNHPSRWGKRRTRP